MRKSQKKLLIRIAKLLVIIVVYFLIVIELSEQNNPYILTVFLTLSIIAPVVYLIFDLYKQKNKVAQLTEESLKAELALLKSQINPHFFFNTLTNLYGLAVEQSPKTPEVILKLSDMMRFTIYKGKQDAVTIEDELQYLDNFIELHKIRYKRDVDIQFNTEIENKLQAIPPMLFINLLENAFKHGVDTMTEKAYIKIDFQATAKHLRFSIENNYESKSDRKPGIGLQNLKRRLQLLYPDAHQMKTEKDGTIYRTKLEINL